MFKLKDSTTYYAKRFIVISPFLFAVTQSIAADSADIEITASVEPVACTLAIDTPTIDFGTLAWTPDGFAEAFEFSKEVNTNVTCDGVTLFTVETEFEKANDVKSKGWENSSGILPSSAVVKVIEGYVGASFEVSESSTTDGGYGNVVGVSTDGGATWVNATTALAKQLTNAHVAAPLNRNSLEKGVASAKNMKLVMTVSAALPEARIQVSAPTDDLSSEGTLTQTIVYL